MGLCASRSAADNQGSHPQPSPQPALGNDASAQAVSPTDVHVSVSNGTGGAVRQTAADSGVNGTVSRTAPGPSAPGRPSRDLPRPASGRQAGCDAPQPGTPGPGARRSASLENRARGKSFHAGSTFREQFADSASWDAYVEQVENMSLPPPRTAATGTLVSAWQAACAKIDEQSGTSAQAMLSSAPMTPDEALARLTDKVSSSSHSSGLNSHQLQQQREDKLPIVRGLIPGELSKSNNNLARSLYGVVGSAANSDAARAGGQPTGVARDPKAGGGPAGGAPGATTGSRAPAAAGSRPASTAELGTSSPRAKASPLSLQSDVLGKGASTPGPEVPMDIDLTQLSLGQEIGRGGFGRVYSGTYQGLPVAVKMLLGASSALSELAALRLEVSILSRTNHDNIMKVYGCNLSPPKPFIVAELLMCSLHDYIYHPQADTRTLLVVRLARGITSALSYLHPAVLHRDLKPGNVLLSHEGNPKIADFGLARWKLKTLLSTQTLEAGSVPYLAPECFDPDNWHLTDRVDVYSVGIIMCEMLMRRPPWHGMSSMQVAWEVHVQGRRPTLPPPGPQYPAALLRLIEACWDQDPKKRPCAADVHRALCELHDQLEAQEGLL